MKMLALQTSDPQALKAFSSLKAFMAYVPKLSIPSSWPASMMTLYSAAESSRLWYSSQPSSPKINPQVPHQVGTVVTRLNTH